MPKSWKLAQPTPREQLSSIRFQNWRNLVGATVFPKISKLAQSLWERVYPRTPAKPVPCTALPASRVNPLPQDGGSPARASDQAEAPNWPWRRSGAAGHWRLKDRTKKVTHETDSRIRLPQRHPHFIVRKIAQSLCVKLSSIRSQSWRNHCGSYCLPQVLGLPVIGTRHARLRPNDEPPPANDAFAPLRGLHTIAASPVAGQASTRRGSA